jgi:two-component system KDP operon response regulator KdpE
LAPDSTPGPTHSVVLVDDDRHVRELIHLALESSGLTVSAFKDGNTALREIRKSKPDLVVTNLSLGNLTGDQLIAQIRGDASLAGIPILVVSGFLDSSSLDHAPDAAIEKPFDPKELVRVAIELIRKNHQGGKASE